MGGNPLSKSLWYCSINHVFFRYGRRNTNCPERRLRQPRSRWWWINCIVFFSFVRYTIVCSLVLFDKNGAHQLVCPSGNNGAFAFAFAFILASLTKHRWAPIVCESYFNIAVTLKEELIRDRHGSSDVQSWTSYTISKNEYSCEYAFLVIACITKGSRRFDVGRIASTPISR